MKCWLRCGLSSGFVGGFGCDWIICGKFQGVISTTSAQKMQSDRSRCFRLTPFSFNLSISQKLSRRGYQRYFAGYGFAFNLGHKYRALFFDVFLHELGPETSP